MMKRGARALFSVCVWIFVFEFFLGLQIIHAAETTLVGGAVVVRPVKTEVTIAPGEEKRVLFRVSNGTPSPVHVSVSFDDVAPVAQMSAVDDPIKILEGGRGVYSLKDFLNTETPSFDLLTGSEREVSVTLHIPKDAEPGGRYGSAIFHFSPIASPSGVSANVALESRIAALLFVRISGNVQEEGKLVAFGLFNNAQTTMPPSQSAPLRIQVAYENTGAVHVNPYGRITIRSFFGDTFTLPIDPYAVLPGATRMREIDYAQSLSPGLYRAHLELNRGYEDIVDEQEVQFWVLPTLTQAFVGLLGVVFVFFLLRRSLRLSRHSV